MGGVRKCELCGALGHKAAICRSPNAFARACDTCSAYEYVSRQCRAARMNANVITDELAVMHWLPLAFAGAGGVGVPRPGDWSPQQGGLVIHGDGGEQNRAGGGTGGGERHLAGGLSLIHI